MNGKLYIGGAWRCGEGEAMGSTDFKELDKVPDSIDETAGMVADRSRPRP